MPHLPGPRSGLAAPRDGHGGQREPATFAFGWRRADIGSGRPRYEDGRRALRGSDHLSRRPQRPASAARPGVEHMPGSDEPGVGVEQGLRDHGGGLQKGLDLFGGHGHALGLRPEPATAPCGSGCPLRISPRLSPHWVTAASARSRSPAGYVDPEEAAPEARGQPQQAGLPTAVGGYAAGRVATAGIRGSAVRPVVISAWATSAWLKLFIARARSAARGRRRNSPVQRSARSVLAPAATMQVPGRRAARASRDGARVRSSVLRLETPTGSLPRCRWTVARAVLAR